MQALSDRKWMGPRTPARTILRDLIRFVLAALVAAVGFALFLSIAVLALTAIAPPAAAARAAHPENLGPARRYVEHLGAEGGTEMKPGLQLFARREHAALSDVELAWPQRSS